MVAPVPRRPTRSGGLPLIALGILLALATGLLVLFITSGATPVGAAATVPVVVAAQTLPTGTVLSADLADAYTHVKDVFVTQRVPGDAIPPNAYRYTSIDDLARNLFAQKQIVLSVILAGDVLHTHDPRIVPLGNTPGNSIVNLHPNELVPGSVLFALSGETTVGAQPGDHVDVLASLCVPGAKGNCQVTQTTLQNLLVYSLSGANVLLVVVTHQEAVALKLLIESSKIDLVLRKPGDVAPANTQAVNVDWIITHYGFTQP